MHDLDERAKQGISPLHPHLVVYDAGNGCWLRGLWVRLTEADRGAPWLGTINPRPATDYIPETRPWP